MKVTGCFTARPGPCRFPSPQTRSIVSDIIWLWRETRHSVNFAGMAGYPAGRMLDVVGDLADRAGIPWDGESVEYFNILQDFVAKQAAKEAKKKQPVGR